MELELKCKFCKIADLILTVEWVWAFESFYGDALVRVLNKKYFLKNLKVRLRPNPEFKLYCPHCRRYLKRVLVEGKEQSVSRLKALVINPVAYLPPMEVVLKPREKE